MITHSRMRWLLILVAIVIASFLLGQRQQAASPQPQGLDLSKPMPTDPQITIGTFANGMRYYIRANKKPEKRAELRLVVKAGSILEDDDQQGVAHLVEHMAFNGTKNFPKHELVSFIESLGMRFGADINAYTSFDETVYILQVPTDKPETMDRSLQILEDWAHNVTFEPAEIDKERGVVLEEWRLGRGAGARNREKIFPIIFKESRYANRLPIGQPEIIKNVAHERVKKFYSDWYRPDLMAVVAVGDFDKAAIEKLVTAHFGSIPAAKNPRPRTPYDIPDRKDIGYAITTDKESSSTSVEFHTLLPAVPQGTIGVYRQKTVERLFSGMLTSRFSELAQTPDAPFLFAFSGRGRFLARSKDSASLVAVVKDGGVERGLEVLLTEAERVSRFGFTEPELARQKQSVLVSYERLKTEKENRLSGSRADEYIRNFLDNETLPTADDEYNLHAQFLPEITLAEINKVASVWFPKSEQNRLVIVTAPEKAGVAVPDATKLAAVLKAAPGKELKPYVDSLANTALLESVPEPGSITKTSTIEGAGLTEWQLSNGVKVVLKPTDFRADEILFRASSPGGTSLASDSDYIPADTATQVIAGSGVGKFNAINLRKTLTGKTAFASPYINELEEGLSGSSSKKDLETMFQLIYLWFSQPRADKTAFEVQANQTRTVLANQRSVPEFAFVETLNSARYQNHLRRRIPTVAAVDEWNLEKSFAFYKDRFSDASDFTFFFVGSVEPSTLKPFVERYLATLPATRRKETWKDVGVRTPAGVVEKTVEKGIEPKSQTGIVFSGPFEFNQEQRVAIKAMAEILRTRLIETIREELGGTYSIGANYGYQKFPTSEYSITIQFGSDPQRVDELVKRVFQEIEKFKTEGATEKQLNDEREALIREFETSSKQNNYLLNQISLRYYHGEDPAGIWKVTDYYKKLDGPTVQQAAKLYLNTNRYVKVTLFPEKK